MQPKHSPSDLAAFRLEQARECLRDAEALIANGSFKGAANRSYYCIFQAMRAVLALESFDSKKHSGVISAFRQRYIKTGIFSVKHTKTIGKAFEVRNDSDYKDMYLVSKKDVAEQIENAKTFLAAVEEYVLPKLQEIEKSK